MNLVIKKCIAPPIVAIFQCQSIVTETVSAKRNQDLKIKESGFYMFEEKVLNENNLPSQKPHIFVLTRLN